MNFYDFLRDLAENNNREWFEQNKKRYEEARHQVEGIIDAVIGEVGRFHDMGDITGKKAMFRIYRDVRFSKDKSPYKMNFSAMISKEGRKEMKNYGYYLQFQPGETFLAAGEYEPSAESLAKIRQEIDYNTSEFKAIITKPEFIHLYGRMQGKQLKTAPKGYDKEHPEIDLLRYTQFYFVTKFSEKEALAPDFPRKIAQAVRVIRPFLDFLARATKSWLKDNELSG